MDFRVSSPRLQHWIYRGIGALALASLGALAWHRLMDLPEREYSHRLVSYDFGFVRRALVGEIYSHLVDRVPVLLVNVEGLAAVLICACVAVALFLRVFPEPSVQRLALACFVLFSPLLLKNYVGNNAKFDVYGAIILLAAAMMPLGRVPLLILWVACGALLLVHHVNATLFIPAIYSVVLLRKAVAGDPARIIMTTVAPALVGLAVLTIYIATRGVSVDAATFQAAMQERSEIRLRPDQHEMWFSTLRQEVAWTWNYMPELAKRLPLYPVLIALHWPLIAFARQRTRTAITHNPEVGQLFVASLVVITFAYVFTAVIIFDHARLFGNYAFCLTVVTAALWLSVTGPQDARAFAAHKGSTIALASLVAAIPWVGTIFPLI